MYDIVLEIISNVVREPPLLWRQKSCSETVFRDAAKRFM
jgi:hypothetical protein